MSSGMRRGDHVPLLRNRPLLRRIARAARPHRTRLAVLAGLVTLSTVLPLAQPLLLRSVIDGLGRQQAFSSLAVPLAAIGVCGALAVFFGFLAARQADRTGHQVVADLQRGLFDHLSRMPLPFYSTLRPGTLASRLTNDVYATEPLFTTVLVNALANGVTLVAAVTVLAVVDPRLVLILLLIPLVLLPVRRSEARINAVLGASFRQNAQLTAQAESLLNREGVLLARQSGRMEHETERFGGLAETVRATSVRLGKWRALVESGYGAVFAVVYAGLLISGAWAVSTGRATLGTLVLFLMYLRQIQGPVTSLVGLRYPAMRAGAAFSRVFDVLDSELRPDEPGPAPLLPVRGDRPADAEAPVLAMDDVWFRHEPTERISIPGLSHVAAVSGPGQPLTAVAHGRQFASEAAGDHTVLRGVGLEVRRGETVAVVGPSGAGKSTLALLAAALIRPTGGSVTVAGLDTRRHSAQELAGKVALITQDTHLLHETVADNVRYVRPGASDAEVEAACRAAQLDTLIASLPDGYATVIGEKGHRLSGGERQRLSIARALLKKADLVVLDEPTSQLDSATEELLMASLSLLFADRGVLVVAHRLTTIQSADRILVLEEGRAAEQGSHAELIGLPRGRYRNLYEKQRAGYSPAAPVAADT